MRGLLYIWGLPRGPDAWVPDYVHNGLLSFSVDDSTPTPFFRFSAFELIVHRMAKQPEKEQEEEDRKDMESDGNHQQVEASEHQGDNVQIFALSPSGEPTRIYENDLGRMRPMLLLTGTLCRVDLYVSEDMAVDLFLEHELRNAFKKGIPALVALILKCQEKYSTVNV
jgi:hypothetical protein